MYIRYTRKNKKNFLQSLFSLKKINQFYLIVSWVSAYDIDLSVSDTSWYDLVNDCSEKSDTSWNAGGGVDEQEGMLPTII